MKRFMNFVNKKYNKDFDVYEELYNWSVTNISDFWESIWGFTEISASQTYDEVIDDVSKMPGTRWFSGARLNFTENLLRYKDNQTALIFRGEDRERREMTYGQLYDEVARLVASLKTFGVRPGDRVAGFMPNMPETVVAMLASVSLGATWSSCSPDFGKKGVLDRFGQIRPKVLFTADGYWFKGKNIDSMKRISDILAELQEIEKVVVVPYTDKSPDINGIPNSVMYEDFISPEKNLEIEFEKLPFDHQLYIMYSSGTTGLPKCMVQSAGGILINQLKELILHTDLKREDTIFYFTTCGWMMWNWLVSSLSVGAALVLYDGNPFHPDPGALWKMAQDEKITVFGTSAWIAQPACSGLAGTIPIPAHLDCMWIASHAARANFTQYLIIHLQRSLQRNIPWC
jgi:acetoacetyl-CoA synthetase